MDTNGQVPKADRGVNHDTPPKASTCSRYQDAGKCSLVSSVDNRMRPSRQLRKVGTTTHTHAMNDYQTWADLRTPGPENCLWSLTPLPKEARCIGSQEPDHKQGLVLCKARVGASAREPDRTLHLPTIFAGFSGFGLLYRTETGLETS